MSVRSILPAILLGGLVLAAALSAAPAETPKPADTYHRVELPGAEGKPLPYTVEIPHEWQVREVPGSVGLWLGPGDAEPGKDPRLVYVRISPVALDDPEKIAANIRAKDASTPEWSAPVVEVREVGGVKGVLVRMDSGQGEAARSTLSLKLPLPKTSVDFMASAGRAEFEKLRPAYERVLFSVRPLAP